MGIFFLGSTNIHPQFAFGDAPSDSENFSFENWLLAAGSAIPLFWLFIFSVSDLVNHPENSDESGCDPTQVPCTTVEQAVQRLRDRLPLLNRWIGTSSPLNYHVGLFTNWLSTLSYQYVTVDWSELMIEEGIPTAYFRDILSRIEAEDDSVVAELLKLSTVDPAHRFITLEDALRGTFTEEEKRNFFFLLGDGDHHLPPWG